MEGADIYQIAKNCRTSVETIETFYASHIKTTLDAAAINVRKGTISREGKKRKGEELDFGNQRRSGRSIRELPPVRHADARFAFSCQPTIRR
jgi:hypothetical protein